MNKRNYDQQDNTIYPHKIIDLQFVHGHGASPKRVPDWMIYLRACRVRKFYKYLDADNVIYGLSCCNHRSSEPYDLHDLAR